MRALFVSEMDNIHKFGAVLVTFCVLLVQVTAEDSPVDSAKFTFPTIPGFAASTTNGSSCANVDCQQGTCVPNNGSNIISDMVFPYKCQCKPGWMTLENVIPILAVPTLPCNIPNCTLNVSCAASSPAPAPVSSPTTPSSDACLYAGICGHGRCVITDNSTIVPTFKCVCNPGYANVLNMTAGYCASQCEIGGNCKNLGITLPGGSSPPPPPGTGPPVAQNATSPNAGIASPGTASPSPGRPISSSGTPNSAPAGQSSPSVNPGCRPAPLSSTFFSIAAPLVLALLIFPIC